MANLNVTYQEMESAALQLQNGHTDIDTQLNSMKGYIEQLVSSGFVTDQASVAFNEQFTQFWQGANQCIDALDSLAGFLRQAATAMSETDTGLANQIRG